MSVNLAKFVLEHPTDIYMYCIFLGVEMKVADSREG
jgi:hypothetical protein